MNVTPTRRRFLQSTAAMAMLPLPRRAVMSSEGQIARSGARVRARELGIRFGDLPTGPLNAITDVAGIRVGHATIIKGDGPGAVGQAPARTGVTAILPHDGNIAREAVTAAIYDHNGNGEMLGSLQIREGGFIASPILITGTWNVGRVWDFALDYLLSKDPALGDAFPCPVPIVTETSDASLNDQQSRQITYEDVAAAIETAQTGPVPEGAVGGGTGMVAYQFKGGIGTASRRLPQEQGGWTVGVLVQANHGTRPLLRIDGVPVGREISDLLPEDRLPTKSIIIVAATDAPLLPNQLFRIAKRCSMGLARTGAVSQHSSGDIFLAFSTTNRLSVDEGRPLRPVQVVPDGFISSLYQPTVEATEEAIVNAMTMAVTMTGRNHHIVHAIPLERLVEVMRRYGRLEERRP
ncbi:MAG TPA: P1 family peptidase [Vicinamibacterales bacterium]|jgi:D-aminopeptidase|nr:P1 family peptidase [Vicinamibacterales bacterium]